MAQSHKKMTSSCDQTKELVCETVFFYHFFLDPFLEFNKEWILLSTWM